MPRFTTSALLLSTLALSTSGCLAGLDAGATSEIRVSAGLVDVREHVTEGPVFSRDAWSERGSLRLAIHGASPHQIRYEIKGWEARGERDIEVVFADETADLAIAAAIEDGTDRVVLGLLGEPELAIEFGADDETITVGGVPYSDLDSATDAILLSNEARKINAELWAGMLVVLEISGVNEDTSRFLRRKSTIQASDTVDCAVLNASLGISAACR
jgi:hypothetical protein